MSKINKTQKRTMEELGKLWAKNNENSNINFGLNSVNKKILYAWSCEMNSEFSKYFSL